MDLTRDWELVRNNLKIKHLQRCLIGIIFDMVCIMWPSQSAKLQSSIAFVTGFVGGTEVKMLRNTG